MLMFAPLHCNGDMSGPLSASLRTQLSPALLSTFCKPRKLGWYWLILLFLKKICLSPRPTVTPIVLTKTDREFDSDNIYPEVGMIILIEI